MKHSLAPLVVLALLSACPKKTPETATAPTPTPTEAPEPVMQNPLFAKSTLPYELPPFDQVKDEHFRPAFDKGMTEELAEIAAIAKNPEPPTFDNTIVALEKTGSQLARASKLFFNLNSSDTNDALQALEAELAPQLAAHRDAIWLDPALFARVDAVYQQKDALKLDPESAQLLERYEATFLRAGAKLAEADKARLKQINEELSSKSTAFTQNVRKAMTDSGVVVETVAELDGFSEVQISAAAEAAKERGLEGKWVITLQNTTTQPALAQLTNRALRERIFRASTERAKGGPADTTELVARLAALRIEKAKLLGYDNYAAYALQDGTARTPDAVNRMLADLAPAALTQAKQEAKDIQSVIDKSAKANKTPTFPLQPWDWAFYAEQVRAQKYAFDDAQIKPYFEMMNVLEDGVFYSANQLYGITFTARTDLPTYHDDVLVYEVTNEDGTAVGLFLLDPFQRDSKQGGAWMDTFVDQSKLFGLRPVVVNNLNIPKPAQGQPVLMTFDQVDTMFHEMGHALHGLFADTVYPRLSGTATPPDFVEYPSQFNEMWAREPAVLANYAKHYETGEPMPQELFEKVLKATTFNAGYDLLEYLKAAQVDQAWHQIGADQVPVATGVGDFESAALKKAGTDFAPVPPRYHTAYFNHVWGGGYEAGYYAYVWSEVLARDTGAWFHANGGMTRKNGDTFRNMILSRGRTEEPNVLFQKFYGKDPDAGPLLEYRGLKKPK